MIHRSFFWYYQCLLALNDFFLSNNLVVGLTHYKCEEVENLMFELQLLHFNVHGTTNWATFSRFIKVF